ncbi:thiamine phosphate synthase [Nemorincola caseinilytica]|uniref:Thiamine-phosphate synthase n=1 Tax=Nemorincola caseinilytica TaxID=2054315 RepID=A0ABP8N4A6_9BACT
MRKISKLHFITTSAALAEQACRGGVDWIQLRLKNVSYEEYRKVALEVQDVCKRYNATLIINDLPRLALDINADGVHLGKEDIMTPEEEAALLAGGHIIGCTTNTLEDILHFKNKPVSYLGLGPFRHTTTKQNLSPILGLGGYKNIMESLRTSSQKLPPVIAIGGIILYDIPSLFETGIHGIALSGAIGNASDISAKAAEFTKLVNDPTASNDPWGNSDAQTRDIIAGGIGEIIGNITFN